MIKITHYQKVVIKINLKYGIEKTSIPTEFKKKICESVNKLFPNWSTIGYEFSKEVNENKDFTLKEIEKLDGI